ADLITVTDRLRDKGQLDDAGGTSYITGLLNTVPTAANVEYHARIVKDKSLQRQVMFTFQHAAQKIAGGDGKGVVAEVRRVLDDLERGTASPSSVTLTPASQVTVEPVEWLWVDRVPLGTVTVL